MRATGGGEAVARGDARAATRSVEDSSAGTVAIEDNPLVPLRRVGVGAALDLSFDLLRFRLRRLVGLAACLILPVQLLDLALRLTGSGAASGGGGAVGSSLLFVGGSSDWVLLTIVLQSVGLSILGICVGHLVAQLLAGRDTSFQDLCRLAFTRSWVALVILPLALLVRLVCAFIPIVGFLIGDALVFVASVAAGAEHLGPIGGLRRSINLSRAAFGPAMVLAFASVLLTQIVRISLYAGPTVLVSTFVAPEGLLIAIEQLAALIQLVVQPLTACIAASGYLLLRTRVEGLDLDHRTAGLVDATR